MPERTYTRTVYTLFTREEMAELLREAHEHCKSEIKVSYHYVGKKRKRPVIARNREGYLRCIKDYINKKVKERAQEVISSME